MLSLIFGIAAAVLSILNNFFGMSYAGLASFALGIAAWVAGEKALEKDSQNRAAFYGRIIGIISTVIACILIGIVIYTLRTVPRP